MDLMVVRHEEINIPPLLLIFIWIIIHHQDQYNWTIDLEKV